MDSSRKGNGRRHAGGSQEWNQRTTFNNMQPHSGFVRPSLHASNPYFPPQMPAPIPPFGNNFMYPDMASTMFDVQGATPYSSLVTPMQSPVYFPFQDPDLHRKIVKQIDYYFSDENLVKDLYLRKNMDEQGWVSVSLISSFKKVLCLTENIRLIFDVMRTSKVVEVKGEKMRKRTEWKRWILPRHINVESFYRNSNLKCNKVEVKGVSIVK
ncbi:hypothetical protein L2E82_43590 [Cichorium intybus]|uniref:Uncharacterized protein n=1 Tax=Cichorium intybus TaxID=13427 RepID=A0ACB8ZT97_CICIN|nr:hypothetical protein L2E82_43590 [Cichorium intybus]